MACVAAACSSCSPAEVDGAGPFARVRHIVVPWLRPTTFFLVVINLIWSFQVFDVVYVMTNGGPGYDTTMLVTVLVTAVAPSL